MRADQYVHEYRKDRAALPDELALVETLEALERNWKPHPMQIQVIAAILKGEAGFTFLQWGRQAGKTEMICYLLWGLGEA